MKKVKCVQTYGCCCAQGLSPPAQALSRTLAGLLLGSLLLGALPCSFEGLLPTLPLAFQAADILGLQPQRA